MFSVGIKYSMRDLFCDVSYYTYVRRKSAICVIKCDVSAASHVASSTVIDYVTN